MYLNGAEKVVYGLQPVEPRPPAEPSRMLLEIVETNQAGSTASTGPRMPASTGILLKDELPEGCLELLQDGSAQWSGHRPCPSVRRPSSKPTCSGGTPTRRDTAKFSMHSRIVDAHQGTPGVEHSLGRGHGELGLAHARGAQERAPRERTSLVGNPARDRRVASP